MSDQEKFPTGLFVIAGILILVFIIYAIVQLATGAVIFISEGGGKWLLVILGLLVFVGIMMAINRS